MIDYDAEIRTAAQELARFLADACAAPVTVVSSESAESGWVAPSGGGRSPWSQMSDVHVIAVPGGVIVSTRWHSDPDRIYLIPLGASDLIAQYQLDRWITVLDLGLEGTTWRTTAHRTGERTYVARLPDTDS